MGRSGARVLARAGAVPCLRHGGRRLRGLPGGRRSGDGRSGPAGGAHGAGGRRRPVAVRRDGGGVARAGRGADRRRGAGAACRPGDRAGRPRRGPTGGLHGDRGLVLARLGDAGADRRGGRRRRPRRASRSPAGGPAAGASPRPVLRRQCRGGGRRGPRAGHAGAFAAGMAGWGAPGLARSGELDRGGGPDPGRVRPAPGVVRRRCRWACRAAPWHRPARHDGRGARCSRPSSPCRAGPRRSAGRRG